MHPTKFTKRNGPPALASSRSRWLEVLEAISRLKVGEYLEVEIPSGKEPADVTATLATSFKRSRFSSPVGGALRYQAMENGNLAVHIEAKDKPKKQGRPKGAKSKTSAKGKSKASTKAAK